MLRVLAILCLMGAALGAASAGRPQGAATRGGGFVRTAAAQLARLFIFVTPVQLAGVGVAVGLAACGLLLAAGLPPAASAVGLLAPALYPLAVRAIARRRGRRVAGQLPGALASLAAGLRAGHALPQALAAVATASPRPLGQELTLVVREAGVGKSLEDGLEALAARHPAEDIRIAVTAISLGRRLGGDQADLLDRVADTIRERQRLDARIGVLTAQGRAQGVILVVLPLALAAAIQLLDSEYLVPLLATGTGRAALAATLALEALGLAAIRRIVAVEP